jgi:preprotein translocase subunit SecG
VIQFLNAIWLLISVFLILVIMVQRGKGGGLAGALGGMGGSSAFGTRAGDVFTKITVGVFLVWLLTGLVLVPQMAKESMYKDVAVQDDLLNLENKQPDLKSEVPEDLGLPKRPIETEQDGSSPSTKPEASEPKNDPPKSETKDATATEESKPAEPASPTEAPKSDEAKSEEPKVEPAPPAAEEAKKDEAPASETKGSQN